MRTKLVGSWLSLRRLSYNSAVPAAPNPSNLWGSDQNLCLEALSLLIFLLHKEFRVRCLLAFCLKRQFHTNGASLELNFGYFQGLLNFCISVRSNKYTMSNMQTLQNETGQERKESEGCKFAQEAKFGKIIHFRERICHQLFERRHSSNVPVFSRNHEGNERRTPLAHPRHKFTWANEWTESSRSTSCGAKWKSMKISRATTMPFIFFPLT